MDREELTALISDAIADSIDMDWNASIGARHVVDALVKEKIFTEGQRDFAWLIEAPGQNYLGARNIAHYPEFYWTADANSALRFWSKDQADLTASAVRRMQPALWAFAANLGEAWPREHGWLTQAAS